MPSSAERSPGRETRCARLCSIPVRPITCIGRREDPVRGAASGLAHVSASGAEVLGDPLKSTVAMIYLASFGVCALVVLAGVVSSFVPAPGGVFVPALVAIVTSIVLRLPLDIWEVEHTARYPQGVDLIPKSDPGDLFLRGEWEENARRTAEQLGFWTIAMAIAAMMIATAIEVRRRRGVTSPPVPPPPPEATMHVG